MKKLSLFRLAWPIFIETALFMTLGFIDVFVLSQNDDISAAAVSTANQAVSIFTLVFAVISTACAVMISQYLGAKRKEDASRVAALSIVLCFIVGIIISIALVALSRPILELIGSSGVVLEYGSEYLKIVGGFLFFQALLTVGSTILRNHGLTTVSMYISAGMNVINTVFDIILVMGLFGFPKMGVYGVALATSVSRVAGTIVMFIIIFKKVETPKIFKLLKPVPWAEIKRLLKIGVPSAFESFNYNVAQLVVTSIVLIFLSDTDLSTKTYVSNIAMFFYIFSSSIGQASQILVGHQVGAGQHDVAYKSALRSFRIAFAITMGMSILGIIFRQQLLGLFTDNQNIISLGSTLIILNIFVEMGRTSNLVIISSLRGAGDVIFPTAVAIFAMWILSTFGSYLLAIVFNLGLPGMWIAFAADECFRGVLMLIRWKRGKWRTKSLT